MLAVAKLWADPYGERETPPLGHWPWAKRKGEMALGGRKRTFQNHPAWGCRFFPVWPEAIP